MQAKSEVGISLTAAVLGETNNASAEDVLLDAIETSDEVVLPRLLPAAIKLHTPEIQESILRKWNLWPERWKDRVLESPSALAAALRKRILSENSESVAVACEIVSRSHEYDLIPLLREVLEASSGDRTKFIGECLIALAESLYDLTVSPRDYHDRRDPQVVRQHAIGVLETGVSRYQRTRSAAIIEAFLILSGRENATLKHVLQNRTEVAQKPILELFTSSPRASIMRLLLSYLEDPFAPLTAIRAIGSRRDITFVRLLCRRVYEHYDVAMEANLKRIDVIGWIGNSQNMFGALNAKEQAGAVMLVSKAKLDFVDAKAFLHGALEAGEALAQVAAVHAIAEHEGVEVDRHLEQIARTGPPEAQAAALTHLREKNIPSALAVLIENAASPHAVVRDAVQASLAEFSLDRFINSFDSMSPEGRQQTGDLVKKVDRNCIGKLAVELGKKGRAARLRALDVADVLGLTESLEEQVMELLKDEDHLVRGEAARALGKCSSGASKRALRAALSDVSVTVQQIAAQSLEQLESVDVRRTTVPIASLSVPARESIK